MSKKETFFVRFMGIVVMTVAAYAETSIGLLQSVETNAKIHMLYRNGSFACEPFGVITLEQMAKNAPDPQQCQKTIDEHYRAHPGDRHFGALRLHVQQGYRFERLKGGCMFYGNGPESYSEMLLSSGLALIDPAFDNKEWNAKLKKAQNRGEREKAGMHAASIRQMCIKEEK